VVPHVGRLSTKQKPRDGPKGRLKGVRCLDSESSEQEAVAFRQFPDGTLVELVRDPSKPQLRTLDDKTIREKIRIGTGLYGPTRGTSS